MANVLVEESSLQAIADTIRSKLGVSDTYLPSEMADAIDDIGGGVTPTGTKQISISQNGTTTEDVTAYASAQITANVPNSYAQADEGKVVNNGALVSQTSDTVTDNGTYDTTLINSLVVDVASGGGGSEAALLDGSLAGEYENALATSLRAGFFENANTRYPNLTKVSLPEATSIGGNAFYKWVNPFAGVNLPKATSIGSTAFGYCNGNQFTKLVLPSVTSMAQQAFRDCSYLTHIDILGGSSTMGSSLCVNCSRLTTFIIRRTDGVVPLQGVNTFDNTPFASGKAGGTLYVPQALIASYQAATNWGTILGYATNSIAAIEGSIYETQYADGTPIT